MPMYREVNRDFFKKWTPEMAYVLGFFAADGTLTMNARGAKYFDLELTDQVVVRAIRRALASSHKITRIPNSGKEKTSYRLQIGSKTIYDDLQKLGFTQRKAERMVMPKIPRTLLGSFVRGYFDGDGHVWMGSVHKRRKTQSLVIQSVFTSGSRVFLEELSKLLVGLGIVGKIYCQSTYYRLSLSIIGSLKLYELMYSDMDCSSIYLKRKKDVFECFIKKRKSGRSSIG